MPHYLEAFNNSYQNEVVRLPESYSHIRQWLSYVPDKHWGMVQQIAGEALEGKHTFENKIKPSSFRVLTQNSGFETIKHLTDEYRHLKFRGTDF